MKNIGTIPFKINENNFINDIFKEIDSKYSKEYIPFYNKFKRYFMKIWIKYFNNSNLNCIYLDKIQHSNSYLENYNHRIKEILRPFLNSRGKSVIPWPLFMIFSKNEEGYYHNLINEKLETDEKRRNKDKDFNALYSNNKTNSIENINNNVYCLKYSNYNCRYDSFTFIYFTFIYTILIIVKI